MNWQSLISEPKCRLVCNFSPDQILIIKEAMLHLWEGALSSKNLEDINALLIDSTTLTEMGVWNNFKSINPANDPLVRKGADSRIRKKFRKEERLCRKRKQAYRPKLVPEKTPFVPERFPVVPPNVKVYDWFLFPKVVQELLDQGYQKVDVGRYVRGTDEVMTCTHTADHNLFCVVTVSPK